MKYDRDIRRIRIMFWVIIVIDLFLLGGALYKHSWVNAIAAAVWALNCGVSLANLKTHQAMRDLEWERGRELTAAMFRELEDLDR